MGFDFEELGLYGAFAITNYYFSDKRGSFIKSYEHNVYHDAGISFSMSETFVTVSGNNVIRGLHFQLHQPQAKLICLLSGKAWDVIVDLRRSSPTYKKWISVELNSEGRNAVYVPRGFAHGFASLSDATTLLYQCDGDYDKETDTGIVYNDETIGVDWPIRDNKAILSDKDLELMSFEQFEIVSAGIDEYG